MTTLTKLLFKQIAQLMLVIQYQKLKYLEIKEKQILSKCLHKYPVRI